MDKQTQLEDIHTTYRKPDVALFLPSLGGGGAEIVILHLAGKFIELGLQVDLVVTRAEGELLQQIPPSVRLIDLHAWRMLASLLPLVLYLRRNKPKALLSTLELANMIAVLAARLSGRRIRTVITMPGLFSQYGYKNLKEKIERRLIATVCKWADEIVAVSHEAAKDLANNSRIPLNRIRVIYNPIISQELIEKAAQPVSHPFFQSGQPPVILGVGRLTPQKDFATLIRSFQIVRQHQPARLVILGEGEERDSLQALIDALGLNADISMPGFVENPFAYMSRANLFVLPSLYESFGNVLAEALACGCPVVCTNCLGGAAEVHDHGKYAVVTPVKDPEQMAHAIMEVLSGKRPQRASPNWLNQFTLENSARQYLETLGIPQVVNS